VARQLTPRRAAVVAALAIVVALVSGAQLVGKPLHWVHVLTLVALGMSAGVGLERALGVRRGRRSPPEREP